jgi:hypothetical protein
VYTLHCTGERTRVSVNAEAGSLLRSIERPAAGFSDPDLDHRLPLHRDVGQTANFDRAWAGPIGAVDFFETIRSAPSWQACANTVGPPTTAPPAPACTVLIFPLAPQLLDVLPDTPLVRTVRELVQLLNAPDEWNGYLDAYWTIEQTVLWVVTGDRWAVDQASSDSGKYGETWGQVRAANFIDKLNLQREEIQNAADKLPRQCLDGRLTAIDGQNHPIPAIEWRHLKIALDDENVPSVRCVGQSQL